MTYVRLGKHGRTPAIQERNVTVRVNAVIRDTQERKTEHLRSELVQDTSHRLEHALLHSYKAAVVVNR
jgi:hypothetical protein